MMSDDQGVGAQNDDAQLADCVRRAIARDPEAQVQILDRFRPLLVSRLSPYQVRLQCDIEDLLQETAMRVIRDVERVQFRGEQLFVAWMLDVAEHMALDLLDRAQAQKRNAPVQSLSQEQTSLFCERLRSRTSTTPSKAAERKELETLVPAALSKLSPLEQWLVCNKLTTDKTELELLVELRVLFPESEVCARVSLNAAYRRALVKLSAELHRLHAV